MSLSTIITVCIGLEKTAETVYAQLAAHTKDTSLAQFWKSMSRQEKAHISYWESLLALAEEGRIRNIFDDPETVLSQLKAIETKVRDMTGAADVSGDTVSAFLLAYRLEFMLMHPAFAALFILMQRETNETSPAAAYESHLSGLIRMLEQQKPLSPEFVLISELTQQLWDANRALAVQLSEISSLRGLLPICMHCKKIRDDKGYWNKVENYIEHRADVTFSHGICPDCVETYYGEYMHDDAPDTSGT